MGELTSGGDGLAKYPAISQPINGNPIQIKLQRFKIKTGTSMRTLCKLVLLFLLNKVKLLFIMRLDYVNY